MLFLLLSVLSTLLFDLENLETVRERFVLENVAAVRDGCSGCETTGSLIKGTAENQTKRNSEVR